VIPPDSWYGVVLKGIFNFNPSPTVIEATAWLVYLIPVLVLYFRPVKHTSAPPAVPAQA
jgi:high-affinity iron transporter